MTVNSSTGAVGKLYDLAIGDEDPRVCKDIPEESCNDQPRNYFTYLLANSFSKIADELCSAPVWGKLSDRSSRKVMAITALLAGLMGIAVYTSSLLKPQLVHNE